MYRGWFRNYSISLWCELGFLRGSPNLDFSDGIDAYYVNHNGSVDNSYVIGRNSYGCFYSPTDPGYTGYVCCISSSGFLGGDAWDYYPHDNSYGMIYTTNKKFKFRSPHRNDYRFLHIVRYDGFIPSNTNYEDGSCIDSYGRYNSPDYGNDYVSYYIEDTGYAYTDVWVYTHSYGIFY